MTNVVHLRPGVRPSGQGVAAPAAWDQTSLVGLLTGMIERIEIAGAHVAALDRPALQIEQAVQSLLDAATALERAAGVLVEGGDP